MFRQEAVFHIKHIYMWHDQGEWVECRQKEVTNLNVLHCLEIQNISHNSGTRC